MKILTYYNGEQRTTIRLSSSEEKTVRDLCARHGFKRLQDYIYYVMDLGLTKGKGISKVVKEHARLEQLTTLETLIKDGRFVQALQMIGDMKNESR